MAKNQEFVVDASVVTKWFLTELLSKFPRHTIPLDRVEFA